MISRYLRTLAHPERFPSPRELRVELNEAAARAADLANALNCLSDSALKGIRTYQPLQGVPIHELHQSVYRFSQSALIAARRVPRGDGARASDALRVLLLELAVVWYSLPRAKHGVVADNGQYRGDLVTFVRAILRLENIRFRSDASLAKSLYQLRDKARTLAAEAAHSRVSSTGTDATRVSVTS